MRDEWKVGRVIARPYLGKKKGEFFAYSPSMEGYGKLEDQNTFAVIGATIADNFEVKMPEGTIGSSLLDELK